MVRFAPWFLPLVLLAGCAEEAGQPRPAAQVESASPPERNAWWNEATTRPSGKERILAPRELRALLATGRGWGFDRDAGWWNDRAQWAYERVLSVDPEDLEANAGVGRHTLQSIEGFDRTWERMLNARFPSELIEDLLDQYDVWVQEGRPIFLSKDELVVEKARLRQAAAHLERMESDPEYGALQVALRRVRASFLSDYPFLHVQVGPFLVFYAARDLQVIPDEDAATEEARVATRREYYRRRLESWQSVYEGVLDDIARLYPRLWQRHKLAAGTIFYQWIFAERTWYGDFKERIGKEGAEHPYRSGFFNGANGWAYLVEPSEREPGGPDPTEPGGVSPVLKETAAYLAAVQILRHWAKDRNDPTSNFLDYSRAYWLKEGWPTFLAARQVKQPEVGNVFRREWTLPPLQRVVERRSRIEQLPFLEAATAEDHALLLDGGYTDLAWLLVRHFHDKEERRERFERFLLSQIEGTRRGPEWFEECFLVDGVDGWKRLERAVYRGVDED